jgi:uncharacterized protein
MSDPTPEVVPLHVLTGESTAPRRFSLHPRIAALWFWQSLGQTVLLGLTLALIAVGKGMKGVALAAMLAMPWPPILRALYSRAYVPLFGCSLLRDGLLITRGVWWRRETFVPLTRIQHIDVSQGPVARRFGVATLKIFTAGAELGQIRVPDLAHHDAIQLRDALMGRHGQDGL